jgi:Rrf2 family protein
MYVSAKADYALRALLELAQRGEPATADSLAEAQHLPKKFAALILNDLRRAGLLTSRRGHGGYQLSRPAHQISVADILRVIDGSLLEVDGNPPERIRYDGAATHLQDVWHTAHAAVRAVLGTVTLEQIVMGRVPGQVVTPADHSPAPGVLNQLQTDLFG